MELYVKVEQTKGVYIDKKCSLYKDEEIELTKNWNDQQIISGYGSWSKTFSLPIDNNNSEIMKYYDIIGASLQGKKNINPNYFLSAKIIINEFEILGNLQLLGFTTKEGQPYSYKVNFYGDEKNLIKKLNTSLTPKLNDVDLSDLSFTFNKNNVVATWDTGTTTDFFVPLMANKRPLNYRNTQEENNINPNTTTPNTTTGITMGDLNVGYKFSTLLNKVFQGFTLQHSSGVTNFLDELYIFPNTKVEFGSDLTYIYTETFTDKKLSLGRNILSLTPNDNTDTGILPGNQDTTSWDNINDYASSTNLYSAPSTGTYNIKITTQQLTDLAYASDHYILNGNAYICFKYGSTYIYAYEKKFNLGQGSSVITEFDVDMIAGLSEIHILVDYNYYYEELDEYTGNYYQTRATGYFNDDELSATIRINKISTEIWNQEKSTINFKDMLVSDFFVNFCKAFNIFFTFNDDTNTIKTYFKYELQTTNYDLSKYVLIDDNAFNHQVKYKKINYKFNEPKDINNLAWKEGGYVGSDGLYFGEYKKDFDYDVGKDLLEYKNIFNVFPRTVLNKTDSENYIIEETDIPLHSELNDSLKPIATDFLLTYRLPFVETTGFTYNLQDSSTSFDEMIIASDYGPDGPNGYSLDYKKLENLVIPNNTSKKYETIFTFLLPSNVLYNLKVYDKIVVNGLWYEIGTINFNISNGLTKIKLTTTQPAINSVPYIPPEPTPTTTTTSTTGAPTTTTTSTTSTPTTTTTTTSVGPGASYHVDLLDMADSGGTNTDHDVRYVAKVQQEEPTIPTPFKGMFWYMTGATSTSKDLNQFELELSSKLIYNTYIENTLSGTNITNVDYWSDSGKTIKLFSKTISYTDDKATTIETTDELSSKVLTTSIVYSGSTILNITKIIT